MLFPHATYLGSNKLTDMVFPEDWVEDSGREWLISRNPEGISTLELRKGGCVGEGILILAVSIFTTIDIDGRNSADACVQRSPIWSTLDASAPK